MRAASGGRGGFDSGRAASSDLRGRPAVMSLGKGLALWCLAGTVPADPGRGRPIPRAAKIRHWGHHPVLNMEYQTDASVGVALRAWTPFIPGDVTASCMPAAVSEVHLRNLGAQRKDSVVAFRFPGASESEFGSLPADRGPLQEDGLHGGGARRTGQLRSRPCWGAPRA